MIKYKDLTPEQKKYICNGCGAKGGWIKPPNFLFKASCNHHDFRFWLGATIKDFHKANTDFYKWMKVDIQESTVVWYKKAHYHVWAYAYYKAVELFGKPNFEFRSSKKTLEDLNREMLNE